MSRSQKKTAGPAQTVPAAGDRKRYRLEMTLGQIVLSSFCLFVVLAWMFVFGILVGRGLPLGDSHKAGLANDFMRFMGLAQQPPAVHANAAATWVKSKQMLKSLDYYQNLTQKPSASTSTSEPQTSAPPKTSTRGAKPQTGTAAKDSTSTAPGSSQADSSTQATDSRFTLLAASLKNQDNAERFVAQLRAKGYAARMEAVDMADSGRWYRVLVGSFDTRDQALQFAAEFNEKEHQQALVIELNS